MANSILPVTFMIQNLGGGFPGFVPVRPKGVRGYGAEAFGDPYGAGGPLSVVYAEAVASQTVRVVFNEEPAHFSAAAIADALNPSNYAISVVAGQGTSPGAVGVSAVLLEHPSPGVRSEGQFGVDVYVDHPFALGVRYHVEARRIQSRAGLGLGFPYGADFMGVQPAASARPRPRRTDLSDMATEPNSGAWKFDGSGDIAVAGPEASYRQRLHRRAMTARGSFVFLKGYGARLRIKELAGPADLVDLQKDLSAQVRREPETEAAAVTVSMVPLPGIATVDIRSKTRAGAFRHSFQVQADGTITFS